MSNIYQLRETIEVARTGGRRTDSDNQWRKLCALLQRGPWLDMSKLLQMIEVDLEVLRQKTDWRVSLRNLDARMRIVCLAKLRLAWLQVQAESDPSWFRNSRMTIQRLAQQTNDALEPFSFGMTADQWLELSDSELDQIRDLIPDVAERSVRDRSRNVICTARMRRNRAPRGIFQTPIDAYRYTEFYEDMDVSPLVLKSEVKGASGRPARSGIMESLSLELAEFEESRRDYSQD